MTNKQQGIAAVQVFIGGACYGANATLCKMAFAQGFTWQQVVSCQMWFATALFAVAMLVSFVRKGGWKPLGPKMILQVMALGALTCLTSILYYFAVSLLPVEVALTLLFQYTWIGLVIQVITTKRAPKVHEVLAVLIILVGTVFASGVYRTGIVGYDPVGLVLGFLSAISCALFLYFSGKVLAPCGKSQRGFVVCLGSALMSLTICPDFLVSGVVFEGIAPCGLIMGFFGMMLPVLLFGLGAPHISPGMSTVLASSELPSGLFVSMVVLANPLGAMEWLGVAAILMGVVVSQFGVNVSFRKYAGGKNAPLADDDEAADTHGEQAAGCRIGPVNRSAKESGERNRGE